MKKRIIIVVLGIILLILLGVAVSMIHNLSDRDVGNNQPKQSENETKIEEPVKNEEDKTNNEQQENQNVDKEPDKTDNDKPNNEEVVKPEGNGNTNKQPETQVNPKPNNQPGSQVNPKPNNNPTPNVNENPKEDPKPEVVDPVVPQVKSNLVSDNGFLKVKGTNLVNEAGEVIVLKGMSSHGLQWFGEFINESNIRVLRDEWNSNVFRIAMYTDNNGYIANRGLLNTLVEKVDMIIKMDMYVIIDWHILSDGDPLTYKTQAKEFFDYVSRRYANTPNVIFEICNEPNGNVNWNNNIKPYADEVISVIRKNNQKAVIIVGTANWSQKVLEPLSNPLSDKNVMYALHFYAGTHKDYLRNEAERAIEAGLPIFVSEWGTSSASGSDGVYLDESQKWIDFMNRYNLSWCNWSLTNKNESSALLNPGAGITDMNNLSQSGVFVKKAMQKK